MEVSGELHAPAALPPPAVRLVISVTCSPLTVWTDPQYTTN